MFQLLFKVGYLCIYEPSFAGSSVGIIAGGGVGSSSSRSGVVAGVAAGVVSGVGSSCCCVRPGRHEDG